MRFRSEQNRVEGDLDLTLPSYLILLSDGNPSTELLVVVDHTMRKSRL